MRDFFTSNRLTPTLSVSSVCDPDKSCVFPNAPELLSVAGDGCHRVSSCHISSRKHYYADSPIPSFIILTEEGSGRLDMRSATTDLHHHWLFGNSIPQVCPTS